jgi:hypothetical protein
MTKELRRSAIFANPFFVVMLGTSVLFVLTVLAYLVPYVVESSPAPAPMGEGSAAFAVWIDHNAPQVLAVEFIVMLVAAVVAMATDPWFTARAQSKRPAETPHRGEATPPLKSGQLGRP